MKLNQWIKARTRQELVMIASIIILIFMIIYRIEFISTVLVDSVKEKFTVETPADSTLINNSDSSSN